jgi:hypothetical protein
MIESGEKEKDFSCCEFLKIFQFLRTLNIFFYSILYSDWPNLLSAEAKPPSAVFTLQQKFFDVALSLFVVIAQVLVPSSQFH